MREGHDWVVDGVGDILAPGCHVDSEIGRRYFFVVAKLLWY